MLCVPRVQIASRHRRSVVWVCALERAWLLRILCVGACFVFWEELLPCCEDSEKGRKWCCVHACRFGPAFAAPRSEGVCSGAVLRLLYSGTLQSEGHPQRVECVTMSNIAHRHVVGVVRGGGEARALSLISGTETTGRGQESFWRRMFSVEISAPTAGKAALESIVEKDVT